MTVYYKVRGKVSGGSMHNIAVLGIGNILLTDDGVGVEVVKRLVELSWPGNVDIIDAGTAILSLLDVFVKNDRIIVVDALKGGQEPGTIYRLTPEQLGAWQTASLSLHDVQVLDVLKMAGLLGSHPEMIFYGIEPFQVELGIGLSSNMEERVSVMLDYVRRELDNMLLAIKKEHSCDNQYEKKEAI
jgi:hydrogenase maturation protease